MAKKKRAARSGGSITSSGAATLSNGSKGKADIDPNQKTLPDMEEDRVPAIETIIKKIVAKKSERAAIKEEVDTLIAKLPPLFKKHDLNQYSCCGKTVCIEPGADVVKIKTAKQQ